MILSTRNDIRREVLRQAGGHVSACTSNGTTATFVALGLSYRGGDDIFNGWGFYDASGAAADKRRTVKDWADTGTGTVATLSTAPASGDIIELYPPDDLTPDIIHDAIDRVMQETSRVVYSVLPTIGDEHVYSLRPFSWIEDRGDVLGAVYRSSPNLLTNEGFENWGDGTSEALANWTLSGTSATVTRINGSRGGFAVRLTRAGNDAQLTQVVGLLNGQLRGESVYATIRCVTSVASAAKVEIYDGVNTTTATAHSGDGEEETLTVSHTVADDATTLEYRIQHETTDGSSDWELALFVEGTEMPDWLAEGGSSARRFQDLRATVSPQGTAPAIVLDYPVGRGGQVVVASRQPFFKLDSDTDVTDMPLQAAVSGTLVKLAERHEKGVNRERWDRIGALHEGTYAGWRRRLSARPASLNPTQGAVVIRGA